MKRLLETNIYEPSGKVMICGTCLPVMQPNGYEKLASTCDTVLSLCLENDHINMAITKIAAILSTGKVTELVFASVNKSPHCTQLHYISKELKRTMNDNLTIPIFHFVIDNNQLHFISKDAIEMSKNLIVLSHELEKSKEIKLT